MSAQKEAKKEMAIFQTIAKTIIVKNSLSLDSSESKLRLKQLVLEASVNGILHHDKSQIIKFFEARISAVCESAKKRCSSTIVPADFAAIDTVEPIGKK